MSSASKRRRSAARAAGRTTTLTTKSPGSAPTLSVLPDLSQGGNNASVGERDSDFNNGEGRSQPVDRNVRADDQSEHLHKWRPHTSALESFPSTPHDQNRTPSPAPVYRSLISPSKEDSLKLTPSRTDAAHMGQTPISRPFPPGRTHGDSEDEEEHQRELMDRRTYPRKRRRETYSSLPPSPTDRDRLEFAGLVPSTAGPGQADQAMWPNARLHGPRPPNLTSISSFLDPAGSSVGTPSHRPNGPRAHSNLDERAHDPDGLSADEIDDDPRIDTEGRGWTGGYREEEEEDQDADWNGEQIDPGGPSGWADNLLEGEHQSTYFHANAQRNFRSRPDHYLDTPRPRPESRTLTSSSTEPNLSRHLAVEDDEDALEEEEGLTRSLRAVSLPPEQEMEDAHAKLGSKGASREGGSRPVPGGASSHILTSRTPVRREGNLARAVSYSPGLLSTPQRLARPEASVARTPAMLGSGAEMIRSRSGGVISSPLLALGSRPVRGRAHSHAHAYMGRSGRRDSSTPAVKARQSHREAIDPVDLDHRRSPPKQGVGVEIPVTPVASPSASIWTMLRDEVFADGGHHRDGFNIEGKWDRIANFLAIPVAVEKNVWFGSMLCLDSFLFHFTVLPIRAVFAIIAVLLEGSSHRGFRPPSLPHLRSLLRMSLVIVPTGILLLTTDASRMYHLVRGQDTIKLYVIFGAVEVADKLCCAFGQDILDTLFAKETLDPALWAGSSPVVINFPESPGLIKARIRKREKARPVFFWLLAVCYIHVHSLVLFYQLVCLNVAINSYDNALLTLLVSNQFTEIKGSVFKKFEKDNLFQILCADIVERYQLSLMLGVIAMRNMIEMAGSDLAFLPKSFIRGKGALETILSPALVVIISEMVTDWLKHAFITKFNHVRASVYERYTDVLCKDILLAGGVSASSASDIVNSKRSSLFADQSPLVTRRLGLATLPLCCLVIRVGFQGLGMLIGQDNRDQDDSTASSESTAGGALLGGQVLRWTGIILVLVIGWLIALAIKILLGLNLLAYAAHRERDMVAREHSDSVNDYGRVPISESNAERAYAKDVTTYLSHEADNMPRSRPLAAHPRAQALEQDESMKSTKSGKAKNRLEDIERWTMVKRIF